MASSLFDLTGRVAVVIGGTSGIGRTIAVGLADAVSANSPARLWTADEFLTTSPRSSSQQRFQRNCRYAPSQRVQKSQRR